MKRKGFAQTTIVLLALTLLSSAPALSQITLQGGGGLGVALPAGDFGGSTIDFYSGTRYGLSTGFNLHGKLRVGFGGIAVAGELSYTSMTNSGESEPGQGKVEVSQKIVSVKIGPEYHFSLPAAPFEPYIGANLAMSFLSGEVQFQGVSRVSSGTFSVKSTSRLGIGFSGGIIVSLGPLISLDIGAHYNILNLTGKTFDDIDPGRDERLDSYLALNDSADPLFAPNDDKHFIHASRAIHSIIVTVSIVFGL